MLLGFKEEVGGMATGFVRKILVNLHMDLSPGRDFEYYRPEYLQGYETPCQPKIHTLREDQPDSWHPGVLIHFATGVRTANLRMFALGVCKSTQTVTMGIGPTAGLIVAIRRDDDFPHVLTDEELVIFARNDGFDTVEAFRAWFEPLVRKADRMRKSYKLIHWTDLRYQFPAHRERKPTV